MGGYPEPPPPGPWSHLRPEFFLSKMPIFFFFGSLFLTPPQHQKTAPDDRKPAKYCRSKYHPPGDKQIDILFLSSSKYEHAHPFHMAGILSLATRAPTPPRIITRMGMVLCSYSELFRCALNPTRNTNPPPKAIGWWPPGPTGAPVRPTELLRARPPRRLRRPDHPMAFVRESASAKNSEISGRQPSSDQFQGKRPRKEI